MDFDTYLSKHPRVLNSIPSGAHIIITSHRDRTLSEVNRAIARNSRTGKFVEAHKSGNSWSIKPLTR